MRQEEDLITRQANMERSVYESAAERFKQEAEQLKKLEINTGLRRSNIQSWMWKWHVDLSARLEVEIQNQKEKEKNSELNPRLTPSSDQAPFQKAWLLSPPVRLRYLSGPSFLAYLSKFYP